MSKKLYEESNILAIANAIRNKSGLSNSYKVSQMASAISQLSPTAVLQEKTVTQNGIVLPDSGYDGLSRVTVDVESGGGGSSGVYVGTTDPDASLGQSGDYYYKRREAITIAGPLNESSSFTNTGQAQAGYNFTTNSSIQVCGIRFKAGKAFSAFNTQIYGFIKDTNGSIIKDGYALINREIERGEWIVISFDEPIILQSNSTYTVAMNTDPYKCIAYSPKSGTTCSPLITINHGVYGSSLTIDTGYIYFADLLTSYFEYYLVEDEYYKLDQWMLIS